MRRLLALALLPCLAACDSAVDPPASSASPLVGTWASAEEATETLVTSRLDQSVPDFSARGTGEITVSGAVSAQLQYVTRTYRRDGLASVSFASVRQPQAPGEMAVQIDAQTDGGAGLGFVALRAVAGVPNADIQYDDAGDVTSPFSFDKGRFTLQETTLTAEDGSDRRVVVGGTLSFPSLRLAGGVETRVDVDRRAGGEYSLSFSDDGRFVNRSADGFESRGTWAAGRDDVLTLTYSGSSPERYTYAIEGETLSLTFSPPQGCVQECAERYPESLYAPVGSFSSVRYVVTNSFRRQG